MKYSYPTLSEVGDRSALILELNQIVFIKIFLLHRVLAYRYFWFLEKIMLSKFVLVKIRSEYLAYTDSFSYTMLYSSNNIKLVQFKKLV